MAEKHSHRSLIRCKKIVCSYSVTVKQGEGIVHKPSLQGDGNFRPQTMNSTEDRWKQAPKIRTARRERNHFAHDQFVPKVTRPNPPRYEIGPEPANKWKCEPLFDSSSLALIISVLWIYNKFCFKWQLRFLPFFLSVKLRKCRWQWATSPIGTSNMGYLTRIVRQWNWTGVFSGEYN